MFVVGYALQAIVLNRTLGADILPPLLVTFGLSIVIQNGLLEVFSADSRRLPLGDARREARSISAAASPSASCRSSAWSQRCSSSSSLNRIFYRTSLGRAFRATSDDAETAQLMGIDNRRIYAVAMGLSLAVCAIAAFFLGGRATFDPTIGPARLIYAFEAVIIGGLGSLWGTLAGGIVVGIAQTVGARINPEWQILAGHLAFLAVLVIRPRGLFPRAVD